MTSTPRPARMAPGADGAAGAPAWRHVVRLEKVDMTFGKVRALSQIDFEVGRNEIVGLLGDNGAGKSTLIKIVSGVLRPTAGRISVRDRPIDLDDYSVRMAHELRIETVHQGQSLGEKQPLWRNLFVGRQITNRLGFIDVKKEKEIADRILRQAIGFRGAGITAESRVRDLSGGERQGIAIARAMHFEADLIVLDEPTAALAVSEVRKVLAFVRSVKEGGRACLYIEHNLAHVHEVADRLVVLDRGRVVAQLAAGDVSLAELTRLMIALHEGSPDARR
ncbi:MAG TPA: ATP-binding cassette domain-containing protein [Anaeromyxobacteraceae bacterium]|nr:ATP-binding cassette domain-containing protein [Anaeromyxobacteraceae bacterium]